MRDPLASSVRAAIGLSLPGPWLAAQHPAVEEPTPREPKHAVAAAVDDLLEQQCAHGSWGKAPILGQAVPAITSLAIMGLSVQRGAMDERRAAPTARIAIR